MSRSNDVPPARQCTYGPCELEIVDTDHDGQLCEEHLAEVEGVNPPDGSGGENTSDPLDNETETQEGDGSDAPRRGSVHHRSDDKSCNRASSTWRGADFADPTSGVWPSELLEREQWMGHVGKKPFAPWGDRDHPDADPDEDARWKWGLTENYVDGATIALAEDDHRLDGRAFLQRESDPYAYVDGDDVRCPETGDVHPDFLEALGQLRHTYADVSQSGSGVHAQYRGTLPDGVKQAAWELDDEPWGANDEDRPSIEIYAGKRVCVATGEHVPGTPTEIREWDADGLEALLEANDQLPSRCPDVESARERFDLENYEPSTTSSDETTDDIRDVFAAIDRLDAQRVADRTIVASWNDDASTSDGERAFWPTWGSRSDNGTANVVNSDRWMDTGARGGYGGPVSMAAIDANACRESEPPVAGETWWRGVEHLRELGFDVPEYVEPENDPVAVLPNTPVERAERNVWDWRGESDDTLEIDDVRERTVDTIASALQYGAERLVDVLPTGGKSYGAIAAAAREDSPPVSIFTTRGRKEQYGQLAEWCDDHGLTHKTIPSFFATCPTARGEHGDQWAERVRAWYRRGATGQDIHKYAEDVLGRPIPCQCDDHGQPVECPYTSAWRFDPDEYDVLIGHYVHAYNPKVVAGRGAIFDEFTDGAYERVLDHGIEGAVTYYLKSRPDVPFDDYTDLVENRSDPERRADGIVALESDLEPDGRSVLEDDAAHAHAPLATFTILAAAENDLGNGLERAAFPGDDSRVGLHDRENAAVWILTPPELDAAQAVVALDGTPTPELWNLTLGVDLHHKPVLDEDGERAAYLEDALGLSIVPTTEWLKPYNSADHVHVDDDAALLEAIDDTHGEKPGVISTNTALDEYDDEDVLDLERDETDALTGEVLDGPADRVRWFGNVLGSNQFKTKRVGAVIGSNHYGDGYIKKWGAYADEPVERNDEKGAALSYGEFGDRVLTHMREHDTLQATLRFGRDGSGATVYVHTDTLPGWVPTDGQGEVIRPKSDGERQVLDAVASLDCDYWCTRDVADRVAIGERRVRQILDELADRGHVRKGQATDDGRAVEWADDGLEELPEHVALPEIEAGDESCGNARSRTIYTHISGTPPADGGATTDGAVGEDLATDGGRPNGGDRPPDDPA